MIHPLTRAEIDKVKPAGTLGEGKSGANQVSLAPSPSAHRAPGNSNPEASGGVRGAEGAAAVTAGSISPPPKRTEAVTSVPPSSPVWGGNAEIDKLEAE